ncbi:MAG TPA: hypothetical protein VN837_04175 [Chloroflexota bacterium]|nr:hypothetical protein [Chloroflexota bacterium]
MAGRAPSPRRLARQPTEGQLQDQIVQGLAALGYVVLQVGRWVRQSKCPRCGAWSTPRSGHGNTPGSPDLLISHPAWGAGPIWCAVELKTPAVATVFGRLAAGRVRPEQRALADLGLVRIATSLEEVLAALAAVAAVLDRPP